MARYVPHPIEGFTALNSELCAVKFDKSKLVADFVLDEQPFILRSIFGGVIVHRVVNDISMPDTEIEPQVGLSEDHLIYIVSESIFFSQYLNKINGHAFHFRMVTGDCCLDVISRERPTFRRISISASHEFS